MVEAQPDEPMEADSIADLPPMPMPILSLNLLQTIKIAQAQHGLRHNDYTRYR